MLNVADKDRSVVAADATLRRLGQLRFGLPISYRGLGLVPLYAEPAPSPKPYVTLQTALAKRLVTITEQPNATVPSLRLINEGACAVLIIDGDEVAGGRQNRVVNTTVLIPAKCSFDLPVSCVEQGRWQDDTPSFASGEAVYPSLRAKKVEDVGRAYAEMGAPIADQGRVWQDIAERQYKMGTRSATHAMRDSYEQQRRHLDRISQRLACPDDGPIGVVGLIAGHARTLDLFAQPDTLSDYWPRLVRSYAIEALDQPPIRPSLDSAVRLLNRPRKARRSGFPSPGLGTDVRFDGNGVTGAALVIEDFVVHAALFRRREKAVSGPIPF